MTNIPSEASTSYSKQNSLEKLSNAHSMSTTSLAAKKKRAPAPPPPRISEMQANPIVEDCVASSSVLEKGKKPASYIPYSRKLDSKSLYKIEEGSKKPASNLPYSFKPPNVTTNSNVNTNKPNKFNRSVSYELPSSPSLISEIQAEDCSSLIDKINRRGSYVPFCTPASYVAYCPPPEFEAPSAPAPLLRKDSTDENLWGSINTSVPVRLGPAPFTKSSDKCETLSSDECIKENDIKLPLAENQKPILCTDKSKLSPAVEKKSVTWGCDTSGDDSSHCLRPSLANKSDTPAYKNFFSQLGKVLEAKSECS